jgi:hypothetical protein
VQELNRADLKIEYELNMEIFCSWRNDELSEQRMCQA